MFRENLDRTNALFKELLMEVYENQLIEFKEAVTAQEYYNSFGVVEVNGVLEYVGYPEFFVSDEHQEKIDKAFEVAEKHFRLDPLQ